MWKDLIRPENFKIIGVYVIMVLALARFVAYPLQDSLAKEKAVFAEFQEAYLIKAKQWERLSFDDKKKTEITGSDAVKNYLYEKESSFPVIQADVLENLIKVAEKKGLVVQGFEMLEPVSGKAMSDAPVSIRLSGKPAGVLDFIQSVVSEGKLLDIRTMEINKSGQDILLSLNLSAFRLEK